MMGVGLAVPAATLHVSPAGSDETGDGSSSKPFRTIQRGVNQAQPGDTVRAQAGEYEEVITSARDGRGARIVFDGQNVATVRGRWSLQHSNLILQNFTVRPGATQQRLIQIGFSTLAGTSAHHAIVSNNVVLGDMMAAQAGIEWTMGNVNPWDERSPRDCLVISNVITGILGSTCLVVGGDNNLVIGNQVTNVYQCDFVRLFGRENRIAGNLFRGNYTHPVSGNHIDFIQTFTENGKGSIHHIIEGNIVDDIPNGQLTQLSNARLIEECGYWVFRNNIFANIGLQASCTIPGIHYLNNVFYRCNFTGGHALTFGIRSFPDGDSYAHNTAVMNNVFLDCGLPTADNSGWYAINTALTNSVADHNFVAKNGNLPVREECPPSSGFRWCEDHGINGGDPLFRDIARLDFRLREGSPLIQAGTPLEGFNTDFDLNNRLPTSWSIGAFEFVPTSRPRPRTNVGIIGDQ
jgi:hypothetical protein